MGQDEEPELPCTGVEAAEDECRRRGAECGVDVARGREDDVYEGGSGDASSAGVAKQAN